MSGAQHVASHARFVEESSRNSQNRHWEAIISAGIARIMPSYADWEAGDEK